MRYLDTARAALDGRSIPHFGGRGSRTEGRPEPVAPSAVSSAWALLDTDAFCCERRGMRVLNIKQWT